MMHRHSIELVIISHRCGVLLLQLQLEHLICTDVRLEVMIAWYESPRHLQTGESVSQRLVIPLPEVFLVAVPSLSTDNVTCYRDKIRLLFADEGPDHG